MKLFIIIKWIILNFVSLKNFMGLLKKLNFIYELIFADSFEIMCVIQPTPQSFAFMPVEWGLSYIVKEADQAKKPGLLCR